jgi:hypothetical protein
MVGFAPRFCSGRSRTERLLDNYEFVTPGQFDSFRGGRRPEGQGAGRPKAR